MQTFKRIRSGFNFFAPFYDFFSGLFFGNSILNSQTAMLPELSKCRKALVFGGGTGKLLLELLKRDMADQYCYVDISDKMIAQSRKRVMRFFPEKINAVQFICGSVHDIPADEKFELIITPHVLDCFTEENLLLVLRQLDAHLTPDGKWLFVDFNIPQKGLQKSFSFTKIRLMYFVFNIICGLGIKKLPDFEKGFAALNCKIKNEKQFLRGFIVARIYNKNETA